MCKYFVVAILVCVFILGVSAQNGNDTLIDTTENYIFSHPEVYPVFPGGENALMKFIGDNLEYPSKCQSIAGIVYVSIQISKMGVMSDPVLERGLDPHLDKEALRVVSLLPREWEPGRIGKVNVECKYMIPVRFMVN